MFNYREYIKNGFLKAIGKMADYQIILNSAGYLEKGVLTEEDLAEINEAIEAQYKVEEPTIVENEPVRDEIPEEPTENSAESAEDVENNAEEIETTENVEN